MSPRDEKTANNNKHYLKKKIITIKPKIKEKGSEMYGEISFVKKFYIQEPRLLRFLSCFHSFSYCMSREGWFCGQFKYD